MIFLKPPRGGIGSANRYLQQFEYMFVFSKGVPKTANMIKDRENVWIETGRKLLYRDRDELKRSSMLKGYGKFGKRTNVWKYNVAGGHNSNIAYEHPAIFPEKLARDHIISWSNEGDLVYDPFLGSGTTAVMAIETNRNWIASEINADYCSISEARITTAIQKQNQLKLF